MKLTDFFIDFDYNRFLVFIGIGMLLFLLYAMVVLLFIKQK